MRRVAFVVFATCISASSSFAGQQFVGSFEDIRAACKNPKQFHNQIAPTNIQVSCKDVRTRWVPDAGTAHSLETSHHVTLQVNSDKYTSNSECSNVASEAQTVGCPAYKQVIDTIETVRSVTCEEILAFPGTGVEFCLNAVESLLRDNPDAVTVQATGATFTMCPPAAPAQEQSKAPQAQNAGPSKMNQGSYTQADQSYYQGSKAKPAKKSLWHLTD
jgi:hypothetical protein